MNAFSPLKIQLRSGSFLPLRILYFLTLLFGLLSLSRLDMKEESLWLVLISYFIVGSAICWHQLTVYRADQIVALDWDVENKMMSVMTGEGSWIPVDRIYNRLSVPGIIQLLVLQRRDRAFSSWMLLTPRCLDRNAARRLHVAITLGAPLEQPQATES